MSARLSFVSIIIIIIIMQTHVGLVVPRACFSLDSTEALQNVDDVHSIPPVATAQSCYNKYQLEVCFFVSVAVVVPEL